MNIIFIFLDSPEICIARIKERVLESGHHVPDEDVKRRFYSTILMKISKKLR